MDGGNDNLTAKHGSGINGSAPNSKLLIGSNQKQLTSDNVLLDDSNLSSLSILNELGSSAISDASADLQLRFQRLLAESALESSTAFADCSIASLSSSKKGIDDFISGTSTPCLNSSTHSNVFGMVNAQKNEEFEALFKKYYSEDFVPAEKALDKLMADEIAWKKEFAFSSSNEKLNLSCFSGIIGEGELSVRSSVAGGIEKQRNKISADEYFGLKTDTIGSLNQILDDKERPNFGHEILSPIVNRPRIAFVEDSTTEASIKPEKKEERDKNVSHVTSHTVEEPHVNFSPGYRSSSTLSVTSIEDILSKHLQDTPGTIARSILNSKGKIKSGKEGISCDQLSSTSDTLRNESESTLTDWVQVNAPQTCFDTYVGSSCDVTIDIQSDSTRWLKCSMSIQKIMRNKCHDLKTEQELRAHIKCPELTLVGPGQRTVQTVNIIPVMPGHFELFVLINSEDAVTQMSKTCVTKFEITCKVPKVEIYWNGNVANEVDFGLLPEGCSQLTHLEIRNYTEMKLPMTIELEEVSNAHTFFLHKNDSQDNETSMQSLPESAEKSLKISVAFKSPSIKNKEDNDGGIISYTAYLNVGVDIPEAKSCLLKKLKLKGSVGTTQLLMNFTSPVELSSPGLGVPNLKTLTLKNGGVVPLKLKLMILDPKSWQIESNGVIIVNNPILNIQPGKEALFTLVFTPSWMFEELIERKLVIHVTPDGNLFEIDLHAKITDGNRGANKERLSTQSSQSTGTATTVGTSTRSMSGMPVQTTHKQLVWNTVPVGRSEKQSCRLRNDWTTPIKVLLTLVDSSHGFWLLNENGEHVLERKVKLHAKECLPVNVVFCPSKIGPACGKIIIREARRGDTAERFAIPLCGYAGTYDLRIKNVPKDKSGHMWINFGPLDNKLETQFSIYNKGNLDAFVFINYSPKGIGVLLQEPSVSINPSKAVITPGSHENIKVIFCLQSDTSFISKDNRDVLELGILYLTCGDDPSRQRIRRIKGKQNEGTSRNIFLDLNSLCSTFPGETGISDLGTLNDPETAIRSLYRTFQQHEIALTVEKTDERSMAMQTCMENGHLANESIIFKSILPDNTLCPSIEESNSGHPSLSWSITPCTLTLLVPQFASGCITISSTFQENHMFEVNCSEEFLSVKPSSGIVPGLGEAVAVITCNAKVIKNVTGMKSTMKVYLENDVKTVIVHIKQMPEMLALNSKLSNQEKELGYIMSKPPKKITEEKKIVVSSGSKLKSHVKPATSSHSTK